jgi:hypothetical protein
MLQCAERRMTNRMVPPTPARSPVWLPAAVFGWLRFRLAPWPAVRAFSPLPAAAPSWCHRSLWAVEDSNLEPAHGLGPCRIVSGLTTVPADRRCACAVCAVWSESTRRRRTRFSCPIRIRESGRRYAYSRSLLACKAGVSAKRDGCGHRFNPIRAHHESNPLTDQPTLRRRLTTVRSSPRSLLRERSRPPS